MNKILLLLFLLLNFSAFSQKTLNGTFQTQSLGGHEGTTYTFHKDGTFVHSQSFWQYSIKGKGNYSINKKVLRLNFGTFEKTDSLTITEQKCNTLDSVKTVFNLIGVETKEPVYFTPIVLKLKNSNKIIAYSQTNLVGVASITLPNIYRDSTLFCSIETKPISYKNFSFEFRPNSCKEIKIELLEEYLKHAEIIPNGTIVEYILKKFSENKSDRKGIILKAISNPEAYETILYKKKTKN